MSALTSSIFVLFCGLPMLAMAFAQPKLVENDRSQLKAVVFLSASCPCSQSHVNHLNDLVKNHPNLKVFGVITDEVNPVTQKKIQQYYSAERFQFPIIQDSAQQLVRKYGALKTPHVVLLQKQEGEAYKVIYEGGVSDRRQFSQSKKKFLQENLRAMKAGQKLPHKEGRSLGCYIRRF